MDGWLRVVGHQYSNFLASFCHHRTETRILVMTNPAPLAVAWKLSGLEPITDEFSFNQKQGTIDPKSDFSLHVYFSAEKAVVHQKKFFKIEVPSSQLV